MLYPVEQWLLQRNYVTKVEIQMPWGICDLVGVKPNLEKALIRQRETGRRTVGDFANAWILVRLPSEASRQSISLDDLKRESEWTLSSQQLDESLEDLLSRGLIAKNSSGNFRKRSSWLPYHDAVVTVELKLSRVGDVISQATRHKSITERSYIALPSDKAGRILEGSKKVELERAGIGLFSTDGTSCVELISPRQSQFESNSPFEILVADRFWSEVLKTIHH